MGEKRHRLQGKRCANSEEKNFKQFLCKQFKAGNCEYGEECRYSHDLAVRETNNEDTENVICQMK